MSLGEGRGEHPICMGTRRVIKLLIWRFCPRWGGMWLIALFGELEVRKIYWWEVPWHTKKGGLRCGHSPKRGVLSAATTRKGGSWNWFCKKKGSLELKCSKGGSWELNYLLSLLLLVNMINRWGIYRGTYLYWTDDTGHTCGAPGTHTHKHTQNTHAPDGWWNTVGI